MDCELIDRQAFIERERKLYCEDCDRRKGMKNGKLTVCYEIGEAPCRSCWLDDALTDLEDAPTIDAVPVTRKSVIGYEGLYEVDNLSRVFSARSGKQMKQMVNTRGYKVVSLTKDKKTRSEFVHRIVASAFVDNPFDYPFVNHIDEDKTNNLPENLEWCTAQYNSNYGTAIKRRLNTLKRNGTSTKGRPSEKQKPIIATAEDGVEVIFNNSYEAAAKTGAKRQNIYACCYGKRKTAKGYKFAFYCADGERREG